MGREEGKEGGRKREITNDSLYKRDDEVMSVCQRRRVRQTCGIDFRLTLCYFYVILFDNVYT